MQDCSSPFGSFGGRKLEIETYRLATSVQEETFYRYLQVHEPEIYLILTLEIYCWLSDESKNSNQMRNCDNILLILKTDTAETHEDL